MKPSSLILVALLSLKAAFAQNPLAERKIIPPSPDAAALGKYGEWPVDLCNGLVKIEIPLYTIKSRSLELPVSLSYHASGIRVNDISSWVGLGWVLNAGGVVSRSVRGKMDEMGGVLNHAFTSTAQINAAPEASNETIFNYLSSRSMGQQDTESDAYAYNAGSISGTFVYDTADNLVQVPLTDNKITANPGVSYTIVSDNGTKYIFDVVGTTNVNSVWDMPTSFYLSKMISADKTDTIYFEYTNGQYYEQSVSSFMSHYGSGSTQCNLTPRTVAYIDYDTKVLQKIRFAGGYADFITTNSRLDVGDVRLTDIKVYTNDNTLQKWIKLDHGYFQSYAGATHETALRMKLDTVRILNKQGSTVERYGLVYNTSTPLPPIYTIPSTHPSPLDWQAYFGQDRWGYFNGVNTNTHFLDAGPGMCSGYANRDVSPTHAQACVLKEIHFPTGGKTIFTYESNNLGMTLGGLRIHKVETYESANSQPLTRQYEYGSGFAGGNMMVLTSDFYYKFNQMQTYNNGSSGETIEIYVSQPTLSLSYSSNAAFYQNVTEYMGTPGNNIGKTEYVYEADQDDIITPGVNNYWSFPYLRYPQYVTSLGWSRGPLKFKREYSHDGTGGYIKVKETENIYQNYRATNFKRGIMVFSNTLPMDHALRIGANIQTTRNGYQYFDIPASTWSKKLKQAITREYANGTELVKTTTLEYEAAALATNPHLLPTKVTNVTSEGNTVDKILQYARDFAGTAAYDGMITENMKASVVKEVEKFNNTDNRGTHIVFSTYTGVGGNMYLPSTVKNYFKVSGWKDKLIFDQYDDRARPRQMHTANNINTCYVWDYNRLYPIAEVTHAAQADIAYSSFEGDDKGNFTFSSAATSDATAPTGKKCYLLTGSNNITKTGLTSGKTYIVSYWVKTLATPLTITGTQGSALQGKTIDGWTYFEHKVTGITTLTITASSRSIDELRLYPSGAEMTTYTYDPVIGMTSKCDANNRVTYYEYDGSDRLKLVRDQDKNILKTMHYNYKSGD